MVYRDSSHMAWDLNRLAERYPGKNARRDLPLVDNYRLALNIAACDGLPLIVVSKQDWEMRLTQYCWESHNLGKAVYVKGPARGQVGAYLVVPDRFGLKAAKTVPLSEGLSSLEFGKLLDQHRGAPKDHRDQVRAGMEQGIRWETKVPVTDPMGRY